jgi:hypothetical protein
MIDKIDKILKRLLILQEVSNLEKRKNGLKPLGQGHANAFRLNRFNPLSYMLVICALPFAILFYGFKGVYRLNNPFDWM